jgi:hypothetical protein
MALLSPPLCEKGRDDEGEERREKSQETACFVALLMIIFEAASLLPKSCLG